MPVLVEANSVIVRLAAIERLMEGGWSRFVALAPNATLCCDSELARVGFMVPADAEEFVQVLESQGFRYRDEQGTAVDLVVADQLRGPMVPCEWVEWGTIRMSAAGEKVTACLLKGGEETELYTPEGWTFEGSLSQRFEFEPLEHAGRRYRFVRHEVGVDIYLDVETGREVFAGRGRTSGWSVEGSNG